MSPAAAPLIRLKGTFHRKSLEKVKNLHRSNLQSYEQTSNLSTNGAVCYSLRFVFFVDADPHGTDSSIRSGIRSPPKVFHTCAKTCGN